MNGVAYVGRPSILGNPFRIGRDGGRREVVAKYRTWLAAQLVHRAQLRAYLWEIRDRELICPGCKPGQLCHRDVIREYTELL